MLADAPAAIAPDDAFLRRVRHLANFFEWHDDFDRWVPSLAGVRFDPDGMSTFLVRLLEKRGQGAAEVQTLGGTSHKPAVVYSFDLTAVHAAGFGAALSPNQDTPIGYAHVSILKPVLTRDAERKARTTLAGRMVLIHGTVDLPKPDGA